MKKANFIMDRNEITIATICKISLLIEVKPLEFAENLKPECIIETLKR